MIDEAGSWSRKLSVVICDIDLNNQLGPLEGIHSIIAPNIWGETGEKYE